MSGKLGRSIAALALCALMVGRQWLAWPSKPIRIIVPFTPGSGTDIIARTVTERLSPQLGQPIVIENRPGAGGTIGAALVAKSAPDGYTLFVHSSSYTVTPSTYKDLPYDTLRDLTGVVPLALLPNVLVMAPSKGIRSVKELVAAAKAKPGSLNSASVGIGSATHLNAERFRLGAGKGCRHQAGLNRGQTSVCRLSGVGNRVLSPVLVTRTRSRCRRARRRAPRRTTGAARDRF